MIHNRSQKEILDSLLLNGPQTVKQLAASTGISIPMVRRETEVLFKVAEVKCDKSRQPYLFEANEFAPSLKQKEDIRKAREQLMGTRQRNDFVKIIIGQRKEKWVDIAYILECTAKAIRELETDGELIDTLEVG